MFSRNFHLLPTKRYQMIGRLRGHIGEVYTLAISHDGNLLASGGTDGLKLWNLASKSQLPSPPQVHGLRGPVTTMVWVGRDEVREMLCYGTARGFLVCFTRVSGSAEFEESWARRVGSGAEVTCMTWHDVTGRLATGTRDQLVQVWTFNSQEALEPIFSVQLDTAVPKTLGFADNIAKDVYVFSVYSGQWLRLRGSDGKVLYSRDTGGMIGNSAVSVAQNQFVVDNGGDGFDLHQLDTGTRIRTFSTRTHSTGLSANPLPNQVAFAEDGNAIVGGSDHGIVYVFDKNTGVTMQRLHHADKGLVQTVATHEINDTSTIVCASSTKCGDISISLWAYKRPKERGETSRENGWTFTGMLDTIVKIVMVLAAFSFFLQNLNIKIDWVAPNLPYSWNEDAPAAVGLMQKLTGMWETDKAGKATPALEMKNKPGQRANRKSKKLNTDSMKKLVERLMMELVKEVAPVEDRHGGNGEETEANIIRL